MATDTYENIEQLEDAEVLGQSYRIEAARQSYRLIHMSPHGGGIELGVTELIRRMVALTGDSYYIFEGLLPSDNIRLHVTSTHFDEPIALQVMPKHSEAISYHGYKDDYNKNTLVGGLNTELRNLIVSKLNSKGIAAEVATDRFTATDPENIVNRCGSGKGVQLEISSKQRRAFFENNDWSKGNRGNVTQEFLDYSAAIKEAMDEYYG
ncbi:hypothetical protein [Bacillus phage SBSphiJ3]|nr:hypothetical protein [Bacillus phage SBSphiJ3]UPI12546.1 hypothetical protein [Bacillus phage SBSphiJ4]